MLSRKPVLLTLPALLLSLGACGTDGAPPAAEASASVAAAGGGDLSLQMREVVTSQTATGTGAPTPTQQAQLDAFDCTADSLSAPAEEEMVACTSDGTSYLLDPAAVDGGVESASAAQDAGGAWVVQVVLGPDSAQKLADLSGTLVGTADQLALVYDGAVLSAPTISARITDGDLQITGDYTEEQATELAERIQAGA